MENIRLKLLVQSLTNNTITKDELEELSALINNANNDSLVDINMEEVWSKIHSSGKINEATFQNIISNKRFLSVNEKPDGKVVKLYGKKIIGYAAAAILICAVGVGLYSYQNIPNKSFVAQLNGLVKSDQTKPSNEVTLTLADGRQVVLDNSADEKLKAAGILVKVDGGQIVYDMRNASPENETAKMAYNTIATPVGSNYQLVLPDGTKVWLNAMSSLKFPVAFSGNERNVELIGEGYFEVARDKSKPFFVNTDGVKIKVLGTHFNVSAYRNDGQVKTSLLEGAVELAAGNKLTRLQPGEQGVYTANASSIKKEQFNANDIMAWKNGYFIFRDESIEDIMKKVSRWYNIEVVYEAGAEQKKYGGKYLKSSPLAELLTSLELTGTVHFKKDGRRVIVMQ